MQISIQIETPTDGELEGFVRQVETLNKDVSAIVLSCTAGINPFLVGYMLKANGPENIYVLLNCRDKNRIAIFSDLLTAQAAGIRRIVFTDGAHPAKTPYPKAKPVYDLDLLQLVEIVRAAREGRPVESFNFPQPFDLHVGVCCQGKSELDLLRLAKLLDSGIDVIFLRGQDGLERICSMTDRSVYVSVDEGALPDDPSLLLKEIGDKGAAGLNIVVTGVDKARERIAALKERR